VVRKEIVLIELNQTHNCEDTANNRQHNFLQAAVYSRLVVAMALSRLIFEIFEAYVFRPQRTTLTSEFHFPNSILEVTIALKRNCFELGAWNRQTGGRMDGPPSC